MSEQPKHMADLIALHEEMVAHRRKIAAGDELGGKDLFVRADAFLDWQIRIEAVQRAIEDEHAALPKTPPTASFGRYRGPK